MGVVCGSAGRREGSASGDLGGGGGIAAAGAGSASLGRASFGCSTFFFLALGMPTPRDLPISTCSTHCTVRLSTQPLRKPSVHWSKACSSAWRARMRRGHHLHGLSGTAKGRQRRQEVPKSQLRARLGRRVR